MLVPTVANYTNFFYAIGNTSATNLTKCVPHGQDADILSLGCGDVRNILYTAYCEKGLPRRKIDVTCCDYDDKVITRNVVLMTMLIDGGDKITTNCLWDLYYHLLVEEPTAKLLQSHIEKLLPSLESLEDWNRSQYSKTLKFCDADTLGDVRRHCKRIATAATTFDPKLESQAFRSGLNKSRQYRKDALEGSVPLAGARSAAPMAVQAMSEAPEVNDWYWNTGTTEPNNDEVNTPNPLFSCLVTEHDILHYGADPTVGFHLATAFAPLLGSSPLTPTGPAHKFKTVAAARTQFTEWASAFKIASKRDFVVRFVAADVFALCHTLQNAALSGKNCANWYRRQWEMKPLKLDSDTYGEGGQGPTLFDMVDTSNLSDHMGALNILLSTAPLLKAQPWATVSTDLLIKTKGSQREAFDSLLCGDATTVSLLIGVSPVQYWTNFKCESHLDEVTLGLMASSTETTPKQLHSRLVWKRDDQFSGHQESLSKLYMKPNALARILFKIYLRMFENEQIPKKPDDLLATRSTYGHFHRGTFATLLSMVSRRVQTDWREMCTILIGSIVSDETVAMSSNYIQELGIQLHLQDVISEPWVAEEIKKTMSSGPLKGWKYIPPAAVVTVVVPRNALDRLYTGSEQRKKASPTFAGSLRASPTASNQWHNMFADVQIAFGKLKTTGVDESRLVTVEEDQLGWEGTSPLIASFVVPTAALQVEPVTALAGICVPPTGQNSVIYAPILGMTMTVFEEQLADKTKVLVTRLPPGQSQHRLSCGGAQPLPDATTTPSKDQSTMLLTEVPQSGFAITTVTGHVDILSEKGKKLLKDKVPIEVHQTSPFMLNVVFGDDELTCPLRSPVPITKDGIKTRIARTSGYIEVIAPLAHPIESACLMDFAFPTSLTSSGLPAALNTPHLHLDNLPILDLEKKRDMAWLTTLTSVQFSEREKRLRAEVNASGISDNARLNFKESLFTMFMLVSGLQGGQTGLFAIDHPDKGGIQMLIFVSAMRLDGDAGSVVLDAAVIPFTTKLITSGAMEGFLLLLRSMECCQVTVNDDELVFWKKNLPSLAERCRTWDHLPTCEYKKKGATVPLKLGHGEQVLCSCGNGKLPDNFIALPEWSNAAPHAVRIAISPAYSVPFVEDVINASTFPKAGEMATQKESCRNCRATKGKDGGDLKKCTRCKEAQYCSHECQKKDWKKHKMECK